MNQIETVITALVGGRGGCIRTRQRLTDGEIERIFFHLAQRADELHFAGSDDFIRRAKSIAKRDHIERRYRAKLIFSTH